MTAYEAYQLALKFEGLRNKLGHMAQEADKDIVVGEELPPQYILLHEAFGVQGKCYEKFMLEYFDLKKKEVGTVKSAHDLKHD